MQKLCYDVAPQTCFFFFNSLLSVNIDRELWLLNIGKRDLNVMRALSLNLLKWACWGKRVAPPRRTYIDTARKALGVDLFTHISLAHCQIRCSSLWLSCSILPAPQPAPALACSSLHSGPHSPDQASTQALVRIEPLHLRHCGLQEPTTSGPPSLSSQLHTRVSHLLRA